MKFKTIATLKPSDHDIIIVGLPAKVSTSSLLSEAGFGEDFPKMVNNFSGACGETILFVARSGAATKNVFLVGLGEGRSRSDLGKAIAAVQSALSENSVSKIAVLTESFRVDRTLPEIAAQLAELFTLADYRYTKYKEIDRAKPEPSLISFYVHPDREARAVAKAVQRGKIIGDAVNYARELQNHPGNWLTPRKFAGCAKELARKTDLKCNVFGKAEIVKENMGALLSVSAGSKQPPRFVILKYFGGNNNERPYVLVGKGITFDTGGISLKRSAEMDEMKFDMSGAAAVLGTLQAAGKLKVPFNIVGLIPIAENMPGSAATRPGDIVTSSAGITIEVKNTDAEGRLILADALTYARRFKPVAVIDLATLTGAVQIALGEHASGLLGNDQSLLSQLQSAGEISGDRLWQLPLWPEHYEDIKGDYGDIVNSAGSSASVSKSAAFLGSFTKDYPWAHVDIAATAWTTSPRGVFNKGGTGVGVRLLIEFLLQCASEKPSN